MNRDSGGTGFKMTTIKTSHTFRLCVGNVLSIKRADKLEEEFFVVTDFYGSKKDLDEGKGTIRLRSVTASSADIYINNTNETP